MVDKIDLTDCFKNAEITAIPDKQIGMTDEQIKKALECIAGFDYELCFNDKCPYYTSNEMFPCNEHKIAQDALDLIKRKDAEIDILIRKKETLRDEIAEQQAEIERLKELIADKGGLILMETAKAEAIKEFAKRLKKEVDFIDTTRKLKKTIDDLVKEMVGDK